MTLCDLKVGESARVCKVQLPAPLKERLRYLGVCEGETLTLLKVILHKTYLVQSKSAKVAVRQEIAQGVAVCRKSSCCL